MQQRLYAAALAFAILAGVSTAHAKPLQQQTICDNNGRCTTSHTSALQNLSRPVAKYKRAARVAPKADQTYQRASQCDAANSWRPVCSGPVLAHRDTPAARPIAYHPPKQATPQTAYHGGAGVVRSGKTGKTAFVDPAHVAKFQAYINDLENNYGATILFMGGGRRGPCGLANQHACGYGQAMDVCQYSWGVVDRRCNLPAPAVLAKVARANGLFEGAEWCRPDTGHVQVRFSGACNRNLYASVESFKHRRDSQ